MPKAALFLLVFMIAMLAASCSSEKFLSDGEHVLSSVKLVSADKKFSTSSYKNYVRQEGNARWFNLLKVPLGIYCMGGKDSTGFSRFLHGLGEEPVIYDESLTQTSRNQMALAMRSRGYLNAYVNALPQVKGHKVKLFYELVPGERYHIRSINYDIDDEEIDSLIHMNEGGSLLSANMPCDANVLDAERDRIINILHRNGYYNVLKKYMYYDIDSVAGPQDLALTLHFNGKTIAKDSISEYTRYRIGRIRVDVRGVDGEIDHPTDSVLYRGVLIRYYGARTLRPSAVFSQLNILRGSYYNDDVVRTTYNNLSRLQILRGSSIHFNDTGVGFLDCDITLKTDKLNQVSAEVEGTNTAGDLGVAGSATFTNRNLFHGSEVWSTKAKVAFEAITGLEGYSDENFLEFTLESRLSFPRIMVPFMSEHHRMNLHGATEFALQYNTQQRPEFHRRFLTAQLSYKWNTRHNRHQHKIDALGVNYVFMPWISNTFRKEYLDNDNARFAIVRHTYEDLFILNTAYNFIYNSTGSSNNTQGKRNASQFHVGIESAGNLLYGISKVLNVNKLKDGSYALFNVAYAQYVKFDVDYARSWLLNKNNTLAFRGLFGIAVPYGNSSMIPYEKRYFAGGANSVRGWSVRELGPGSYKGEDGKVNFINQTGNMRMLFQMELRSYLFWKLSGAFFVDAGNIWTTRNYEAQPGGQFHFDTFLKQMAASYGVGLRFNMDYFILRFDMAMKGVNPSYTTVKEHYPLLNPKFSRDFTFHFAVGLPF